MYEMSDLHEKNNYVTKMNVLDSNQHKNQKRTEIPMPPSTMQRKMGVLQAKEKYLYGGPDTVPHVSIYPGGCHVKMFTPEVSRFNLIQNATFYKSAYELYLDVLEMDMYNNRREEIHAAVRSAIAKCAKKAKIDCEAEIVACEAGRELKNVVKPVAAPNPKASSKKRKK